MHSESKLFSLRHRLSLLGNKCILKSLSNTQTLLYKIINRFYVFHLADNKERKNTPLVTECIMSMFEEKNNLIISKNFSLFKYRYSAFTESTEIDLTSGHKMLRSKDPPKRFEGFLSAKKVSLLVLHAFVRS